jgi:hypothetical protein
MMLGLKERLDADPSRGQILLTGSANLLALASIHDALPCRLVYLGAALPLSGGRGSRAVRPQDLGTPWQPWFNDWAFNAPARHGELSSRRSSR